VRTATQSKFHSIGIRDLPIELRRQGVTHPSAAAAGLGAPKGSGAHENDLSGLALRGHERALLALKRRFISAATPPTMFKSF
jgi:hypothetical protein